jgi:hypothetical protein
LRANVDAFFFLKLTDWESEHEYRFAELTKDDEYSYVSIGDTLAAVVVGPEFPRLASRGSASSLRASRGRRSPADLENEPAVDHSSQGFRP